MIRFSTACRKSPSAACRCIPGAILEANLLPPPEPRADWRDIMDELSDISCDAVSRLRT